jgi:uncharacterized protein YjgD (DUF1641 family)
MMTVDQLILHIVDFTTPTIEEVLSKRDSKVLRSFGTMLKNGVFFTENQSKLLLKILQENKEKFKIFQTDIETIILSPTWSKPFRQVDVVRKFYIADNQGELSLFVEFTYSGTIRRLIQNISKKVEGLTQITPAKLYSLDLTEKNIVELVEVLRPLNFVIDDKIIEHYNTIKSWSEIEVKSQFFLTTMINTNFQKHITDDLGLNNAITQDIINDRSIRYNYFVEKTEKNPENLTEIIANRNSTTTWIDKKQYSLSDVIESLVELKRFPLLVVFEGYDEKRCFTDLQNLAESLEKNRIFSDIGIYFRLDNSAVGKEFNQYIADKHFNSKLEKDSIVCGVQSGKIPKFLLKTAWKPMSVISLGNAVKNSKTAVYTSCCDLIISYSDTQPIIYNPII